MHPENQPDGCNSNINHDSAIYYSHLHLYAITGQILQIAMKRTISEDCYSSAFDC